MSILLKKNCSRPRKGSLLLEAILSVLIMSVCLVLVIQGFMTVVRATRESDGYARAVFAGENMIFALMQAMTATAPWNADEIPRDHNQTIRMTKQPHESGGLLEEVDLEIQWRTGSKSKSLFLSTLLLDTDARKGLQQP